MKGQKKTVGLLLGVLSVLTAVYAVLRLTRDPLADGVWFDFSRGETVESIQLENTYGQFRFYQEEGVCLVDSGGVYRTNERKMALLCQSLEDFQVLRVLDGEAPGYGLETSPVRVRFTTSAGSEYALAVGNQTMSASDRYVKDLTDGRVFITDGASAAQLTGSLAAYRYKEVFTIDKTDISAIRYSVNGALQVALELGEDGSWYITQPYDRAPARTIEMNELLTQLRSWTVAGYVDTQAASHGELGLDGNAPTLQVTDGKGNTQTLIFGISGETTTCVQTGRENEVVLLYSTDIDLSTLGAEQLLFIAPLKTSIDQVQSIQVSVSTGDYIFTVEPGTGLVSCNGRYVDQSAFSGIFFKYIGLIADGADLGHAVPPQEAVAYFRTTLLDGSVTEMTAYGRDQGTCYMKLDGETVYYLETGRITELVSRIQEALAP